MNGKFRMTLNSPLTKDDWAKITDTNMEHTKDVTFQTEGGKKLEFTKVVRCKDCKHRAENLICYAGNGLRGTYVYGDWFCADGEPKEDA